MSCNGAEETSEHLVIGLPSLRRCSDGDMVQSSNLKRPKMHVELPGEDRSGDHTRDREREKETENGLGLFAYPVYIRGMRLHPYPKTF